MRALLLALAAAVSAAAQDWQDLPRDLVHVGPVPAVQAGITIPALLHMRTDVEGDRAQVEVRAISIGHLVGRSCANTLLRSIFCGPAGVPVHLALRLGRTAEGTWAADSVIARTGRRYAIDRTHLDLGAWHAPLVASLTAPEGAWQEQDGLWRRTGGEGHIYPWREMSLEDAEGLVALFLFLEESMSLGLHCTVDAVAQMDAADRAEMAPILRTLRRVAALEAASEALDQDDPARREAVMDRVVLNFALGAPTEPRNMPATEETLRAALPNLPDVAGRFDRLVSAHLDDVLALRALGLRYREARAAGRDTSEALCADPLLRD